MVNISISSAPLLLILAQAVASAPSGQSCYLAGNILKLVSVPNTPPCWVKGINDLPDCYSYVNGKCPNFIGVYDVSYKVPTVNCDDGASYPAQPSYPAKPSYPTQPKEVNPTPQVPVEVTTPIEKQPEIPANGGYPVKKEPEIPAKKEPETPVKVETPVEKKPEVSNPTPEPSNPGNIGLNNGKCALPSDSSIIPITPGSLNKGWAMSPDQECKPGTWCPYACAPGMYSAQYDQSARVEGPSAGSMNGGLFCESNGNLRKPFPERPLCAQSMRNVFIDNRVGSSVSLCQTTYPGNEAMLIPTVAKPNVLQVINTPPKTYWQSTSSHFYINPINSSADQCIWGQNSAPVGNWAPFVCGSNQGNQDFTYVKIGINPEFVTAGLQSKVANPYKLRIECDGKCNLPDCVITINDPIEKFCVATVTSGTARIVLFQ